MDQEPYLYTTSTISLAKPNSSISLKRLTKVHNTISYLLALQLWLSLDLRLLSHRPKLHCFVVTFQSISVSPCVVVYIVTPSLPADPLGLTFAVSTNIQHECEVHVH